jgi:hypothetical protein
MVHKSQQARGETMSGPTKATKAAHQGCLSGVSHRKSENGLKPEGLWIEDIR